MKAKEIISITTDTGAKWIRLIDPTGQMIVPQNNPKVSLQDRAGQIEKILNSKHYPDGVYFLEVMQNLKTPGSRIPVTKGEIKEVKEIISIQDNTNIQALEAKILELQDCIDDLLEEQETLPPLEDKPNNYEWITTLAGGLLPVVEKYFDIAERKLTLSEKKYLSDQTINPVHDIKPIFEKIASYQTEAEIVSFLNALELTSPVIFQRVIKHLNNEGNA